jgi:hypothetical protein
VSGCSYECGVSRREWTQWRRTCGTYNITTHTSWFSNMPFKTLLWIQSLLPPDGNNQTFGLTYSTTNRTPVTSYVKLPKSHSKSTRNLTSNILAWSSIWVCACTMHQCVWLCIRIRVGRCVSGRDGEERWHIKHLHTYLLIFEYSIETMLLPLPQQHVSNSSHELDCCGVAVLQPIGRLMV